MTRTEEQRRDQELAARRRLTEPRAAPVVGERVLASAPAVRHITIGATRVELHPGGLTVTRYADGTSVPAVAHGTAEYLERARAHGYGDDAAAMSRDHEIVHTLLAWVLDGGVSPALWRVAHGEVGAGADGNEEAAVMAFQRWARARGVDLVGVGGQGGRGWR